MSRDISRMAFPSRPGRVWRPILLSLLAGLTLAGSARGDVPAPLNWEAWQRMPVLHDGRLKPLDSFARTVVRGICGRENPRLAIPNEALESSDPAWVGARNLFPDGKPRAFSAAEILFSWAVEPEKWERVPFLAASNEELREKGLGVPARDKQGNHLKFVSPHDVAGSKRFTAALEEMSRRQAAARRDLKVFQSTEFDQQLRRFYDAYATYRQIALRPLSAGGLQGQFKDQLARAVGLWMKLRPSLGLLPDPVGRPFQAAPDGLERPSYGPSDAQEAGDAVRRLVEVAGLLRDPSSPVRPAEVEPLLVALRASALKLADQAETTRQQLQQQPGTADAKDNEERLVRLRAMASQLDEMARLVNEAEVDLYDTGHSLAIVPAIHAAALEEKRDPREGSKPWLSLQAVLAGSDLLVRAYPQAELDSVRKAFRDVESVYLDRQAADRPDRFQTGMENFAAAVAALGQAIEPLRDQLPIKDRDAELMAATAYPAADAMDLEVFYNRLDPFTWTWVLSLAAVACFLFSGVAQFKEFRAGPCRPGGSLHVEDCATQAGPTRPGSECPIRPGIVQRYLGPMAHRAMFWSGLGLLLAAQAFTIGGLAMRIVVTHRAPVTNMFETIVFVALVTALMGTCFALTPLLARGFEIAWRLTASPGWHALRLCEGRGGSIDAQEPRPSKTLGVPPDGAAWQITNGLVFAARLGLMAATFYLLAIASYGTSADETVVRLSPRVAVEAALPTFSDLMAWAVGLGVLGLAVWFVPRGILAGLLALVLVPASLAKEGIAKPLEQVVARKAFALAGAAAAFLAAYVACNASVFDKNISPIMPVLRNNFWLTSHVLTITASYGAGALAWGLANIALGYYLFGRYRRPDEGPVAARDRRAPEVCAVLAAYIYKAAQVAVVLLIGGTILGALWADVSWGRFWGWDSKEVWALISALVYLAILHGRYAGLFGNLGVTVGAVFGATSILLAWYGVNYLFGSGLHTYGSGTGGQFWVVLGLGLNWAFVAAALVRHRLETATLAPAGSAAEKVPAQARFPNRGTPRGSTAKV